MVLLALSFAGLAPGVAAQVYVPTSSPLVPSGLSDGDEFRLLFVTSTRRNAAPTDIADYNSFVQGRAQAGHNDIRPFATQFRVLGSTQTVSATTNTGTTGSGGVPIYWVNGDKVADDYDDFYDGDWDSRAPRDESGNAVTTSIVKIFTGTRPNGESHTLSYLGNTGPALVQTGSLIGSFNPLNGGGTAVRSSTFRFYALSPVLTAGSRPPTVTLTGGPSPVPEKGDRNNNRGNLQENGRDIPDTSLGLVYQPSYVSFDLHFDPLPRQETHIGYTLTRDGVETETGAMVYGNGSVRAGRRSLRVSFGADDSGARAPCTQGGYHHYVLTLKPDPRHRSRNNPKGRPLYLLGDGVTSATVKVKDEDGCQPQAQASDTPDFGPGALSDTPDFGPGALNDEPPPVTPVVSISGGSAITEGGTATFILTASPAPTGNITVNLNVADSGDFAASGQTGTRQVSIPTGGTASFTVTTVNDNADEPDGSITATVNTSSGYSPHTQNTATVTVNDNDDAPAATSGSGGSPSLPASDHPEEQEQSPDREALEAIYDAAGGENWTTKDSWKTDEPIDDWYGVTVNSDGRVTELKLEDNNLEGTLHQDVGELDKLRSLYVNGNSLRGDIPLTQLQGLESLEELALWGNELTGDITDELGKRVDRAALRKIKDVNGSALTDWFREDDTPFDYSRWSEVEVNDNGRVTGLDLSGVGLSGELTEAVWEISELSELDLSENPDLRGEVPARVMDGELEVLDVSGSGVCAEESEEFARWLESINFTDSENCGETESSGGGSGGCFLASGDVSGERAYQMVIIVLVLAAVVGASRIARAGR